MYAKLRIFSKPVCYTIMNMIKFRHYKGELHEYKIDD